MNPVYSTDGPSRKIYFYKKFRPIVLYHVSPKVFHYKSNIMMLAVIALEDIGQKDLWQYDMDGFRDTFSRVPYEEIRDDLKITPKWIRNLILELYEKRNGAA